MYLHLQMGCILNKRAGSVQKNTLKQFTLVGVMEYLFLDSCMMNLKPG